MKWRAPFELELIKQARVPVELLDTYNDVQHVFSHYRVEKVPVEGYV